LLIKAPCAHDDAAQVSVDTNSTTDFLIDMDDGLPPLEFASKERDVFYATYNAFVHRVIASKGFEERQQLLFDELRNADGGSFSVRTLHTPTLRHSRSSTDNWTWPLQRCRPTELR
jgi:hypothetical protein